MFHVEHSRIDGLPAEYQEQAHPRQIHSGVSDQMLRGYRGIVAALVGLIAIYWLVDDLSSVSRQIQSEASYRADEYGKDADAYIERRCVALPLPAGEDCNREADQAARENRRVELDLAAQRITAWWTQTMGVAALLGMALSAIGVWLVWTTFRELVAARMQLVKTLPLLWLLNGPGLLSAWLA